MVVALSRWWRWNSGRDGRGPGWCSVIDSRINAGACGSPREGCRVRRYDCRPVDIHGSVQVRMAGVATVDTEEPSLRGPICLLTMPTVATGLARIRGVHQDQAYTGCLCFVGDEGAELKERPRVQHTPMATRTRQTVDSATDVLEILQSDSAPCAFCRADEGLADTVVGIAGEAPFPAAPLLEEAHGVLVCFLWSLARSRE
jgi:hypothetical protein